MGGMKITCTHDMLFYYVNGAITPVYYDKGAEEVTYPWQHGKGWAKVMLLAIVIWGKMDNKY